MRCLEIEAYRMKEFVISEAQTEKAVLVGLVTQTQNERKTNEYLDELAFLAETAGAEVVKRFTQKLDTPNSVTYVGKGKLQEIREYLQQQAEEEENEIGMVIFDDDKSCFLSHIAVRRDMQKNGIGTALLSCTANLLDNRKITLICKKNVQRFYINCGFTATGTAYEITRG